MAGASGLITSLGWFISSLWEKWHGGSNQLHILYKKWMFGSRTSLFYYYFQPIGTEYSTLFVLFPNRRPFTPDIFNSLSPYYNCYMVNTTIQDLQQVFNYSQMTSNFPSLICFCSTNDTKEAQLISNIEGGLMVHWAKSISLLTLF